MPKRIAALAVLIGCVVAGAVVADAAPNASRPRAYSITDLGTLGGSQSFASAINNRGQIVGSTSLSGDASIHAFLYERGQMVDLLPGPTNSFANDINKRGKVVGTLGEQAFLYRRGNVTLISLGGLRSFATGINDRGDVVGSSEVTGLPEFNIHAFLYRNGQTIDLTPTLVTGEFGQFSVAQDINNRGAVVGYVSPLQDPFPDPFLWRNGTITRLPLILPGDDMAIPNRINNSGEVVGFSQSFPEIEPHAVLLSHGRLISVGPGLATSINNRSQVVGWDPSVLSGGAFIWKNGTRTELDTLLPPGSGWTGLIPADINDRGQIVGTGVHNGATRAFLLSPSKEDDDDD
jgi:probable HAF family extracellular repeat protein